MASYFQSCVYGSGLMIGIILCGYLFKSFLNRRAYNSAMHLNGCQPMPKYAHKDPFLGLDYMMKAKRAMKAGNLQKDFARQNFDSYGKTFETHMMGMKIIYTMDYSNIQTVQNFESDKWGVAPLRGQVGAMMGQGIFVSDGPVWSHSRKALRPVFHHSRIEDFDALEKHFSLLLRKIPNEGSTVDLQDLFSQMFVDFSMEYLFGEPGDSDLDSRSDKGDRFVAAYATAFQAVVARQGIGLPTALDVLGKERAFKKAVGELHALADEYVDRALKRRADNLKSGNSEPSPEQPFVFLDWLTYQTQEPEFLRTQLLNIFFPARDSSYIGVSFIFFNLARHPEVWTKLRTETSKLKQPFTREGLRSSLYLNQVVRESLRLLSSANRAIRTSLQDCILPYGGGSDGSAPIYISKGTHIDMNFGHMQREKLFWGDDADKFRPERWSDLNAKRYMPFFAGPRRCPAQESVLMQYLYLLARMSRLFESIENRDEVLHVVERYSSTMSSQNGVKVTLIPAKLEKSDALD